MPPSSGSRPTRGFRQAEASPRRAATTMSQPSTISNPPPTAWPLTRAITGTFERVAQRDAAEAAGPRQRPVFEPAAPLPPFMSAPVENARSPAPVSTTTRTSRSLLDLAPDLLQLALGGRIDGVQHVRPVDRDARDVVRRPRRGSASLGRGRARLRQLRPAPRRCAGRAAPAECGSSPARPTCGSASRRTLTRLDHARRFHDHAVDRRLLVGERLGDGRAPARTAGPAASSRASQCAVRVGLEALAEHAPAAPALFAHAQRMGRRSADRPRQAGDAPARCRCPQRVRP